MGVSVAIAALGSAFAFIAKSVSAMSGAQRLTALLVILAVVLGPIVLAGVLKLMRQDMGPIIEGCGWAVNKSMRLTRKLRRQFTLTKAYPEDAEGTPAKRAAVTLGVLVVLLALAFGAYCWTRQDASSAGDAPAEEAVCEKAESVSDPAAAPEADAEPAPAAVVDAEPAPEAETPAPEAEPAAAE